MKQIIVGEKQKPAGRFFLALIKSDVHT